MPAPITTRAQVNGYRFLIRRLEHALVRADSRMIHDPMRGQLGALLVGSVVAMLIGGGASVLAFIKPAPNFGDSTIMLSKSHGELFVRIGDRLHPVLNLASARLIAGKSDVPKEVDDKFLNSVPLAPTVGIIGAPESIDAGDDLARSSWTVCDSTQATAGAGPVSAPTLLTTILANDAELGSSMRVAASQDMLLSTAGGRTFLVYDGVRALIDPADPILANALRLGDAEIRPMSPSLLTAFPLVDPIVPITIDGAGDPAPSLPAPFRVGSILRTVDSRGERLYVAVRQGLQPISAAVADIIRYGNPHSLSTLEPTTVSPSLLNGVPVVHVLRVEQYPAASPRFVHTEPDPVVCMYWQRATSAAEATTRLLIGDHLPLPDDARAVALATADGNVPGLDMVYVKPGTGEYVQSTSGAVGGRAAGQLFYVSDLGIRFHIMDALTAETLGVAGIKTSASARPEPQPAPWSVLSLLPAGPELSQQAALIAHDGMAADPGGQTVSSP